MKIGIPLVGFDSFASYRKTCTLASRTVGKLLCYLTGYWSWTRWARNSQWAALGLSSYDAVIELGKPDHLSRVFLLNPYY